MEDYYDYYLARPPQSHGKSLTFPPPATEPQNLMDNQIQDMNYTAKYVPGSLGTITETEKESVTSSESFRRKEFEKLDSFALEPEEVNKRFINFLRERNKDIDVIELEDRIAKELDLDISDEEIRKVIGELHIRNKELREGKMRNKESFVYDVERLKEEVLELKKQHNYDKAVIKILKINLRKGRSGQGRTEKLAAKEKEKNKLLERLQAVYDENIKLKQDLQVQDQDYKLKISKLNALNSEMTKMLNAKYPAMTDKNVPKGDAAAHVAVLRLKMKGMTEESDELKQKIEKYESDMMKLRQTIEDRDPAKFEGRIAKLKEENEELVVEKEYIMAEMKLDKQLQTLFPNTGNLALVTLNFAHQVEKNRFIKTTYNKVATGFLNTADKAFSKLLPAFEKMGNRIMFHITKNSEYHPDTKKIVQATITAWNNSSIAGKHLHAQNEEIKMLEDRIKFLEKEVEDAGVAGRPFSLMQDEGPKKGEGEKNQSVYSLKDMDEHKKQWDNLPPFVKRYIKQLEAQVIGIQLKKGKKKNALKAEEDDKGASKAKKPKKENQALPMIVEKKNKEQNTIADASKQNEKKDKSTELAALGFAAKIKKDLATTETKPKKTDSNKTKEK